MLQIQLGKERKARPNDAMGRTRVGHWAGQTEQEAWEAGRGVWKLKPQNALAEDEIRIVNTAGDTLAVGTITGVTKADDRFIVDGNLLLGDPRVGKKTPTPHPSRNSVHYC